MCWGIIKKRWLIVAGVILFAAGQVRALDALWESGHHEINDGELYREIWMHNDATADMWGGHVYQLGTQGTSIFNMYGGTVDMFLIRYNSTVNIYGGIPNNVGLAEDALVNLHAYDVVFHPMGGDYYQGWLEGKYISNDQYFTFDFAAYDNSHINVIPEPTTLLLFSVGSIIFLRKR